MEFGAKYVDFFWWGGRVLLLCFVFNVFHSVIITFGFSRVGFYTLPNQRGRILAISISSSIVLMASVVMSILGAVFYYQNVRPMKLAQTAATQVFTDMDLYGSLWVYLVYVGWPLFLFLIAIRKLILYHRGHSS